VAPYGGDDRDIRVRLCVSALVLAITSSGCAQYVADRSSWNTIQQAPKAERRYLRLLATRPDGTTVLLIPSSVESDGRYPGDHPSRIRLRPRARPLLYVGAGLMAGAPLVAFLGGLLLNSAAGDSSKDLGFGQLLVALSGIVLIATGSGTALAGTVLMIAGAAAQGRVDPSYQPPPDPGRPEDSPAQAPSPAEPLPPEERDTPVGRQPF
jgi:hypothetical protein